jgi:multidrug efflux pump subunit AcrA (membrane-fusion protein)
MSTDKDNLNTKPATGPGSQGGAPAKATSADELNKLLKITHPYHWLFISGLVALVLFTIIWSMCGSIPTRIQGLGQITSSKGLHAVIVRYQGQLRTLYVHLGDTVKEGQVIAKISEPELEQELLQLRNQLDVLQDQYNFLKTNNSANLNIKDRSSSAQKERVKKN